MRKFFLFLMVLGLSLAVQANDKLSAPTMSFLNERASGTLNQDGKRMFAKSKAVNGVETIDCFISLNEMSVAQLEAKGVTVTGVFDGIVTALVPVDNIEEVANLNCVKQIAIARTLRHLSDQAKVVTNAEKAWNGPNFDLPQAYNGKDVVVGIIDGGIEFNHLAFKDADGNTRIKAAYLPNATSGGSAASVGGVSFTGRQYTGDQIASLTTDDTEESHGTHTSGCAGGSTIGGYSGMAPGCDLVLCGLGSNMTETSISNAARYIATYAHSVGKPCVISISLGSNMGPHDGKSSICKIYDQVATQYGAVILLAAGNEADATGYASKTMTSDDDALTIIHEGISYSGAKTATLSNYAAVDVWNNNNESMTVKVMVVNKSTGAVLYTSNAMSSGTISTSQMGTTYFSSATIRIYNSTSGGRRNIYIQPSVSGAKNSNYRIAYSISAKSGNTIQAWSDGGYSSVIASSGTIQGYDVTYGTAEGTMSDDICGSYTISVGAMASRLKTPRSSFSNSPYSVNDVAYFSSYGTDCNGVDHPFITAPGHAVIAPINKLDTYSYSSTYLNSCEYNTTINGQKDYWDAMSGTSMATPIAAGVVALYLQADPTLDVNGVKDIIRNTATAYTNPKSPDKQRGLGIINALDGIRYIVEKSGLVTPVATEATEVGTNAFTANWTACDNATSYTLRLTKKGSDPLFAEAFEKCTTAAGQNIGSNLNAYCDNEGWTGNTVYQANGGLRLGSTNTFGFITTPALDLSDARGKVYVKISALAFGSDTDCQLVATCGEASDTIVVPQNEEAEYTIVLDCEAAANQNITFKTTAAKKRVILTSVDIFDAEPSDNTNVEPILFPGLTGTSYTVTDLDPATIYFYDVKAFYAEGESNWSNLIKVTTLQGEKAIDGDVNGDGVVTAADVTALYNYLLNGDDSQLVNGDQNKDGEITAADVTTVYSILLSLNNN